MSEAVEKPTPVKRKADTEGPKLVTVQNLTHSFLRQPSTGIVVMGKAQAEMKDDGWLQNQIGAGLLKAV